MFFKQSCLTLQSDCRSLKEVIVDWIGSLFGAFTSLQFSTCTASNSPWACFVPNGWKEMFAVVRKYCLNLLRRWAAVEVAMMSFQRICESHRRLADWPHLTQVCRSDYVNYKRKKRKVPDFSAFSSTLETFGAFVLVSVETCSLLTGDLMAKRCWQAAVVGVQLCAEKRGSTRIGVDLLWRLCWLFHSVLET